MLSSEVSTISKDLESKELIKTIQKNQRKSSYVLSQNQSTPIANNMDVENENLISFKTESLNSNIFSQNSEYTFRSPKIEDEEKKKPYPFKEFSKTNYLDYGLHINLDDDFSPESSKVNHEYLPNRLKNDEKYKAKLFSFLRDVRIPSGKTDKCKQAQYFSSSENFNGNITKFEEAFQNFGRKKKIAKSHMKIYSGTMDFIDGKGKKNYFKVFRDNDIGVGEKWQKKIIEAFKDDDVLSDDDQIEYAKNICATQMKEALQNFNLNRSSCSNFGNFQRKNAFKGEFKAEI